LKLEYDELLPLFAFNFHLRRYFEALRARLSAAEVDRDSAAADLTAEVERLRTAAGIAATVRRCWLTPG